MKLKSVGDFKIKKYWMPFGLVFGACFMVGGTFQFMATENANLFLILLVAGFGVAMLGGELDSRETKFAVGSYEGWLSEFDLSTLLKIRTSEEIDVHSRKVVTEFLNEHHENWSLNY